MGFILSLDPTLAIARRISDMMSAVKPTSSQRRGQFISYRSLAASMIYSKTVRSLMGPDLPRQFWNPKIFQNISFSIIPTAEISRLYQIYGSQRFDGPIGHLAATFSTHCTLPEPAFYRMQTRRSLSQRSYLRPREG